MILFLSSSGETSDFWEKKGGILDMVADYLPYPFYV